jgi:hypothetical protein
MIIENLLKYFSPISVCPPCKRKFVDCQPVPEKSIGSNTTEKRNGRIKKIPELTSWVGATKEKM